MCYLCLKIDFKEDRSKGVTVLRRKVIYCFYFIVFIILLYYACNSHKVYDSFFYIFKDAKVGISLLQYGKPV